MSTIRPHRDVVQLERQRWRIQWMAGRLASTVLPGAGRPGHGYFSPSRSRMAAMSSTPSKVIVMGRHALLEIARLKQARLQYKREHIVKATA
jgi:hypothetical protein